MKGLTVQGAHTTILEQSLEKNTQNFQFLHAWQVLCSRYWFVCLFLPEGKIDNNLAVETGIFFVLTVCYGEIFIKLALNMNI